MSRVCECGCGESLDGRHPSARFYDDRCRARAWKAAHNYGRRDRPRKTRANGQRGGLQVSYRKAVESIARKLAHDNLRATFPGDWEYFIAEAEDVLAPALSDRQRETLGGERRRVT